MNTSRCASVRVLVSLTALVALAVFCCTAEAEPVLWINDANGALGRVDVATGAVTIVGHMGIVLTDIAFAPNGDLYGISFTDLYRIDSLTAGVTLIGPTGIPGGNALVFGADGTLYGAGGTSTNLYSIDSAAGAATSLGGIGAASAGDLAFIGNDLYMSTTTDLLIKIALAPSVSATAVGPLGVGFAYGLATPDNNALYALALSQIYSVDVVTAAATHVVGYGGGLTTAFGSSFVSEAPEPAALLLASAGVLGSLVWVRRFMPAQKLTSHCM